MMHRTCDGIVSPASARRAFQRHNVLTCSLILVINRRPFSATNSMRHSNLSVVDDKPPSAATKSIRYENFFSSAHVHVSFVDSMHAVQSTCPRPLLSTVPQAITDKMYCRCVPRFDYVQSMRAFEADPSVCPLLMLAPMVCQP